jgi:hypothetical protein
MIYLFAHQTFKRMIVDVTEIEHINFGLWTSSSLLRSQRLIEGQVRTCPSRLSFVTFALKDAKGSKGFPHRSCALELNYFEDVLPEGTANRLVVDIKDTCGSAFTYTIYGPEVGSMRTKPLTLI